jgi:hypothetical protein
MWCKAERDGHGSIADNHMTVYSAALILAIIMVAAPVLAQSSEGALPDIQIDAQPSRARQPIPGPGGQQSWMAISVWV